VPITVLGPARRPPCADIGRFGTRAVRPSRAPPARWPPCGDEIVARPIEGHPQLKRVDPNATSSQRPLIGTNLAAGVTITAARWNRGNSANDKTLPHFGSAFVICSV
jgi:hypothetical protein